tara:strand:- start:6133 stop:6642 length:510 start_codon:yes stop_codon:yes gene_type:complete
MKNLSLAIVSLLLICSIKSIAQDAKVESGLMYYLTKYVEWPANKHSSDFIISIVGNSSIETFLESLASSKMVGTRKIVINKVNEPQEAKNSHIIFFPKKKIGNISAATGLAKSNNILIVSEGSGMVKKGAGVSFTEKNGKTGFEISPSVIKSCGLKVSSKLLDLGTVIN